MSIRDIIQVAIFGFGFLSALVGIVALRSNDLVSAAVWELCAVVCTIVSIYEMKREEDC